MVGIGGRLRGRGPHCWFGRTIFSVYTLPHCSFEEGVDLQGGVFRSIISTVVVEAVSGGAAELGPRCALITGNVHYMEIQRSIMKTQDKDSQAPFVTWSSLFTVSE